MRETWVTSSWLDSSSVKEWNKWHICDSFFLDEKSDTYVTSLCFSPQSLFYFLIITLSFASVVYHEVQGRNDWHICDVTLFFQWLFFPPMMLFGLIITLSFASSSYHEVQGRNEWHTCDMTQFFEWLFLLRNNSCVCNHYSFFCLRLSTDRGDRTLNYFYCQNFRQVFTGVPIHIFAKWGTPRLLPPVSSEAQHTWMGHVTCEWDMSRICICQGVGAVEWSLKYVTYDCVMSHMDELWLNTNHIPGGRGSKVN